MSSSILFPTNQYATSSKSSEQIQKLIIPEQVQTDDIFTFLLNKNHPLQMPYVYKNFHKAHKGILNIICQKAVTQNPQNVVLICESLKEVFRHKEKLNMQELDWILNMTIQCLNNLNSVSNEGLCEILQIVIKVHPEQSRILNKLQTEILQLGKASQPTISKVTSGRLISIVSKYLNKTINGKMIDIVKRILADTQVQAKKVWLTQIFPKLLSRLQLDFVELHLQQKIYECIYDQNQEIGLLSLQIILKNAVSFSLQEQSSRIVKLFIDSLTSKSERISLMVTEIMGEVFQKLINIIMASESLCTRFWRSLIELAQSKNQKVLNNLVYNLPGILLLSSKFHSTEPLVEVYCELFYEPLVNKITLISYFHQIVFLFPQKKDSLKQLIYWIFGELFEQEEQDYDLDSLKIINAFLKNLFKSRTLFFKTLNNFLSSRDQNTPLNSKNTLNPVVSSSQRSLNHSKNYHNSHHQIENMPCSNHGQPACQIQQFQLQFCQYLLKYLNLLQHHKNIQWLDTFFTAIKDCAQFIPCDYIERSLLPKIYSSIKIKCGPLQKMVQLVAILLRRDIYNLMNFYASKIHVEFSKSTKSHERQAALQFLLNCSLYFSIQTFQQYKLGEKFLSFSNDKFVGNRLLFIKYSQRLQYFLTREEKIQLGIVIAKMIKDNDTDVIEIIQGIDLTQKDHVKLAIIEQSKILKQKQKLQAAQTQSQQPGKSLVNISRQFRNPLSITIAESRSNSKNKTFQRKGSKQLKVKPKCSSNKSLKRKASIQHLPQIQTKPNKTSRKTVEKQKDFHKKQL